MNRICVIDIPGVSMRLLKQTPNLWLSTLAMSPEPMKPVFPALWAPMQASLTTGAEPGKHGIVAAGIFRRESRRIGLDERSNTLLAKKRFWQSQSMNFPKSALVMWSYPLAGAADVVLGAMNYGPCGTSLCDQPLGLYREVADQIGPFDAALMRGPTASWAASSWIASAAETVWRRTKPAIQWVYLPGVDYEIVRNGVLSAHAQEALRAIDLLAHRLAEAAQADGAQVVVLSDGGYVDVSRVAMPNLQLLQAGLLRVRQTDLGNVIDMESSQAIAVVDHQIAHVYCKDPSATQAAADALRNDPAIAAVLPREELFSSGAGLERAGELVAMAHPDAWLHYRWWLRGQDAPRAAGRWDVPGKCGWDPCELFAPAFGPAEPGSIDPNPNRVRASRGLVPSEPLDWAMLASTAEVEVPRPIETTSLAAALKARLVAPGK